MCNLLFSLICFIFLCTTLPGGLHSSTDVEDVPTIASNLLELPSGSEIPPLIVDLLRSLPKDVKDILKDRPLYELSKEQMASIPVPLLYLIPKSQLYNLSGYQHAMLLRGRPDILSLADLAVNSMEEPDLKIPFMKSLQKARNLSAQVQDAVGRSIVGWQSTEIEFEAMYGAGDPLAVHLPLPFMLNMGSKLKGEMMFYLRTWLWDDHPYRGANMVKWFQKPWSVRRVFTKLCIEDNYPAPLAEWKYNHIEAFSHLIPTMSMAEFAQINLKERFNYKKLLNAPLNTLQIRYLFDTMYTADQLYNVEFQEFSHFLSALQPRHLNRFFVNATDLIHAKYHLNNMTYATAKQIAEIIKVQTLWTDSLNTTQRVKQELSNIGPLLYTMSTADLAKLDPAHVDKHLLASLDTSKLSFPQVYELGHVIANISLATPLSQILPQSIPAQTLQDIEPQDLPYEHLLDLLRRYPGTQDAFTATLMNRLRSTLNTRDLEHILQNPHRNKLLKYLPVPEDPTKLYTMLSQLYEQPMYRVLIDQVDSSLIRTIMPAQVSYKMYIKDQFLFKGITCTHINNINTYELVVFVQDYFSYVKADPMATPLTKQSMVCWFARLHKYLMEKATLPLLDKIDGNDLTKGENRIDRLSRHELRAFGNVVIMFNPEEIVASKYLDEIVEVTGRMPREYLDVMKRRADYEAVLRRYFEKTLNTTNMIKLDELLTAGNLTHYIPTDLIAQIDPKSFKVLVETKLVDTRVCGDGEYRRKMEELIIKAFDHVSTWTPDVLVLLKDFLLSLSEDQLNQIPTESWTGMADLIVSGYDEPALNEHGVAGSFYRTCMTRLNSETESQEYLRSLSALIQFYLVKLQSHLNSIKSADEIMTHSLTLAMTSANNPVHFKPTIIDDDEMMTNHLILDIETDSLESELDTTTAPTTTEVASEDPMGNVYNIIENNVKTNESEFKFWDVFPTKEANLETTSELANKEEPSTTMVTIEENFSESTSRTSSNNKSTQISAESWEKSEENFSNSSEEEGVDETKEDSDVVDQIIDISSNEDVFNENQTITTAVTETPEIRFSTSTKSLDTTVQNSDARPTQEQTTPTADQDLKNDDEAHSKEHNLKGNILESEQSKDIIVNDLTKWYQNHEEREQNEIQTTIAQTTNQPEIIRHKKENRIESYTEATIIPIYSTTEHIARNVDEPTTHSVEHEKLNKMISNMPTVPSEDPGHDNEENEASNVTKMIYQNQVEDGYLINPEDQEILERKLTDIETTIDEIVEDLNNTVTTDSELKTIPMETERSVNTPNENHITPDMNNANQETTLKYSNHEYTTNQGYEHKQQNSSETTVSHREEKLKEKRIDKHDDSHHDRIILDSNEESSSQQNSITKPTASMKSKPQYEDPNQYQNKLTDELSTVSPHSYEFRNTDNDLHFDDTYKENNDNEYNVSTLEDETNNYATDHSRDPTEKYLTESKDENTINTQSPWLSNHYSTETESSAKLDEHNLNLNNNDENDEYTSTSRQPKMFEMEFKSKDKSDESTIENDVSETNTTYYHGEINSNTIQSTTIYDENTVEMNKNIEEGNENNTTNISEENTTENHAKGQIKTTTSLLMVNFSYREKNNEKDPRENISESEAKSQIQTTTGSLRYKEERHTDKVTTESTSVTEDTRKFDTTITTASNDEENITQQYENIDSIPYNKIDSIKNSSSEESKMQYSNTIKLEDNEESSNYLISRKPAETKEETTTGNIEYKSKLESNRIENLDDHSYLQAMTESFEEKSGARSNLISLSEAEKTKIPSNYKNSDFVPQTIKLNYNYEQNKDRNNESKMDTSFRGKDIDDFVVYDIPDDVTPQDIQEEESHGNSYTKSRKNKSLLKKSEESSPSNDLPEDLEVDKSSTYFKNKISENTGLEELNKDFGFVVLDVIDEPDQPKKRSYRRRRRFVMNSDNNSNPTNMNITCEALNILGTLTDVIPLENIIMKLNKESLFDCLDLMNKVEIPRRSKEIIINRYYKNINAVLPLLGNILADLTLEEIRGINMNVWSLEIMEHMHSVNDTKRAELIIEKYMKKVNRSVLNLNEMTILNNMLCYLPENVLKKSLVNMTPVQLLNILKYINTCSTKCLTTFSSLALNVLGTPMNWKYEQVYHLGTVPSGLNDTMWNEFIQQKHLKFNMNENNYKCLNEKRVSSINIAVLEEYTKNNSEDQQSGISEIQQDYSSGSVKISSGSITLLVQSYVILSLVRLFV